MKSALAFFLDRPVLIHVITVGILVLGLRAAFHAQREGFPAIDLNVLYVTGVLPGASAEEVETRVVVPIEEALDAVDGIDQVTSTSSPNLGVVRIGILEELDHDEATEVEDSVRRALSEIADFPDEMDGEPVVHRANPGQIPVMEVALSGLSLRLPDAAERLERAIGAIDGVGSVTVVGVPDREVRVLLDAERARQHGVALTDVVTAIQRRNVASTGGTLQGPSGRREVVLRGEFASTAEAGETVLFFLPDGRALRVGDVARIEEGREDDGLRVHCNGRPGASLVVRKRESADIIDVARSIRETVAATPLPEGVEAVLVNDGSFQTRTRLALLASNGTLGLVLVLICLFAFLDPRSAVWVAAGVPTVLLVLLVLMPFLGMTVNLISLAGMVVVLGMLVDDAVVVCEEIAFLRQRGRPAREAALLGASTMLRAVTASSITTLVAFSPILELTGTAGKLAWQIPAVVVLSLAISLLECFFVLPVHVSMGRSAARTMPRRRFVIAMEAAYRRVLLPVLRWRLAVLLVFAALLFVALAVIRPRIPFVLFPQDDSDALYVVLELPPGTPIERTEAVVASIERQVPPILGRDLVATTARIGHEEPDNLDRRIGTAPHKAAISILLAQEHGRRTAAEWAVLLGARLDLPPDATVTYRGRVVGPPMGRPVTVHVSGDDDGARRSTAEAIAARLRATPGVVDVEVDEEPGIRQLDLRPDWARLSLLGLDAEVVALTLKAALHGIPVTEVRTLDETVTYRVSFDPVSRGSLESLLDAPVRSRTGRTALLRDVARPVEVPSISAIHHLDGVRTATIYAGFDPASGLTSHEMARRLEREVFPALGGAGVSVRNGGEAEETAETLSSLFVVLAMAVLAICLVIIVMLDSVLDALFVALTIPFGGAGVLLTFFAHGRELSLFAMLGAIGLAGVVVNSAIVMVDAIKRRLRDERPPGTSDDDVMVQAVVERLSPVLVTTITTIGAVLPTAYGLGGYDAVLSPMSLALGWGLTFSTVVTLLLVPCLYAIAQDLRALTRRFLARTPEP